MNVGTICYATQSGLGHLGKMFYDNGVVNRMLIVQHSAYEMFDKQWYPDNVSYSQRNWRAFLDGLDVLLVFETAMGQWHIVKEAKVKGIKFAIIPMYEWTPDPIPAQPDIVICPSKLDVEYYKNYKHVYINIPAPDPKLVPWKERTHAIQFVHNAGHGQIGFAKGTPETLEAFRHTESDARLIVRAQYREPELARVLDKHRDNPLLDIRIGDIPYNELFSDGDVYINAERYNGLSLPLQESFSSGMLVMTTNRFPANDWLPLAPLIPVKRYEKHRVAKYIDRAEIDPKDIARTIDNWYRRDISIYSHLGRQWAEENSWTNLKPKYLEILGSL